MLKLIFAAMLAAGPAMAGEPALTPLPNPARAADAKPADAKPAPDVATRLDKIEAQLAKIVPPDPVPPPPAPVIDRWGDTAAQCDARFPDDGLFTLTKVELSNLQRIIAQRLDEPHKLIALAEIFGDDVTGTKGVIGPQAVAWCAKNAPKK